MIILTNGGAAYPQALDLGIARRYIPALVPRREAALSSALLDSYTGYYNAYGSQLLKVTRAKKALVLDDGNRLAGAFLPLSEAKFIAEDADRGFTITRAANNEITGMVLRLITDEMPVQRIGPLAHAVSPQPDPDPALSSRIAAVLKAFESGGKAVEQIPGAAAQAKNDYSHGPSPELAGIRDISFIAAWDVPERQIERHGAKVSRVIYYRLLGGRSDRYVLVYLTADGLVTDQDVADD